MFWSFESYATDTCACNDVRFYGGTTCARERDEERRERCRFGRLQREEGVMWIGVATHSYARAHSLRVQVVFIFAVVKPPSLLLSPPKRVRGLTLDV